MTGKSIKDQLLFTEHSKGEILNFSQRQRLTVLPREVKMKKNITAIALAFAVLATPSALADTSTDKSVVKQQRAEFKVAAKAYKEAKKAANAQIKAAKAAFDAVRNNETATEAEKQAARDAFRAAKAAAKASIPAKPVKPVRTNP